MADVKVTKKTSGDAKDAISRTMRFMQTNRVLVGIPQANEKQWPEEVSNAELLFIHTNGSPVRRIPPRPVLEPAIEKHKDEIATMLKTSVKLAFEGRDEAAHQQLAKTGLKAQNICRGYFTDPDNGWAPNSPKTQARKRAKGSDDPKPLIDTGEMRKSIVYVIQKGRRYR